MSSKDSHMAYSVEKGKEEHILALPQNRQIAYAHNGPASSRTVVIFFVGLMAVGTAPRVPLPCMQREVRWIAPTLPGMGNSSTRDKSVPYHISLARDISALLDSLYPPGGGAEKAGFDELYIAGGSYGSVAAQMLYGAPYEIFPAGRKLVAACFISGFSPLKYHTGYAKTISWANYFSFGPPARCIPGHGLQRLFRWIVGAKIAGGVDGAKAWLRQVVLDKMDAAEKENLKAWLAKKELSEDEFLENIAQGTVRCCQNWDGFMEVADVVASDWGFAPNRLDKENASKPVLVVSSADDDVGGGGANDWLVANYRNARLMTVSGGHISSLFFMDEIWDEVLLSKAAY